MVKLSLIDIGRSSYRAMTEEMKGLLLILNQFIPVSFVSSKSLILILVLSKHTHSMELIIELSKEIAFNQFILQEKSYLLMLKVKDTNVVCSNCTKETKH